MTMAVGFNLQITGNTDEDGSNEETRSDNKGVEHDIQVSVKVLVDVMDDFTNDAVTNGTPQTLTTEQFFAEVRVRGQLAHDHGIEEGESTGSEEEADSIDEEVDTDTVNLQGIFIGGNLFRSGNHDGEEKETHEQAVTEDTAGNNQAILSGAISKTREDERTSNVGELDEVGERVFTLGDVPSVIDVLEEERVGGVDDDVQTKVEQLGEDQPIFEEIGEGIVGATRFFIVGNHGRVGGTNVRRLFSSTGHVDDVL